MDDLITEYANLIRGIAKKFYNVDKEDLYQAGCLGLIKAYNNYQDKEIPFHSYAYKYIFGEMYELTMKSQNIKFNKMLFFVLIYLYKYLNYYYLKLYKLINKTSNSLSLKYGRSVSLEDISSYLDIDIKELEYALFLMNDMLRLDDEYEGIQIGNEGINDDLILLNESLDSLDSLSSAVIKYRYLFDLTQEEVGKKLGISQVKVSRIESSSKKKILEYIS